MKYMRLVAAGLLILLLTGYMAYSYLMGTERKARSLLAEGEYHRAVTLLAPAVADRPRDSALARLYAEALTGIEDWEQLRKLLRQREELGALKQLAAPIHALGQHYLSQGKWLEAARWLEPLAKLDQLEDVDQYMELAFNIAQFRGKNPRALQALEHYPEHPLANAIALQLSFWEDADPGLAGNVLQGLEQIAQIDLAQASPRVAHLIRDFQRMLAFYAVEQGIADTEEHRHLLGEVPLYMLWQSAHGTHPLDYARKAISSLLRGDEEAALAAAANIPGTGLGEVLQGGGWQLTQMMEFDINFTSIQEALWSPDSSELLLRIQLYNRNDCLLINIGEGKVSKMPGDLSASWNPAGTVLASGRNIRRDGRWQEIDYTFNGWLSNHEMIVRERGIFHVYNIHNRELAQWDGPAPKQFSPQSFYAGPAGWRTAGQEIMVSLNRYYGRIAIVDYGAGFLRYSPGFSLERQQWFWSAAGNKLVFCSCNLPLKVYDLDNDKWSSLPTAPGDQLIGWQDERLLFSRYLGSDWGWLYYSVEPDTMEYRFHYLGDEELLHPRPDGSRFISCTDGLLSLLSIDGPATGDGSLSHIRDHIAENNTLNIHKVAPAQ